MIGKTAFVLLGSLVMLAVCIFFDVFVRAHEIKWDIDMTAAVCWGFGAVNALHYGSLFWREKHDQI